MTASTPVSTSLLSLKSKRRLIKSLTVVSKNKIYYPNQTKNLLQVLVEAEVCRQIRVDYAGTICVAKHLIVAKILNSGRFPNCYVTFKREEAQVLREFKVKYEVQLRSFIRQTIAQFNSEVANLESNPTYFGDSEQLLPVGNLSSQEEIALKEANKALEAVCREVGKPVSFEELPKLVHQLKSGTQRNIFRSVSA